jgi:hypothetical protein
MVFKLPVRFYISPWRITDLLLFLGFKRCLKCSIRHYRARSCPTLCTSSAAQCIYRVDSDFGFPCNACLAQSPPEKLRPFLTADDYDFPQGYGGMHFSLLIIRLRLNDLIAPIFRCTKCFMIHSFPKCPAICTANSPCAYVPYSLLVLPCTQCVAIEDVDESLKDIIKSPTNNLDLSRKVPIFLYGIPTHYWI